MARQISEADNIMELPMKTLPANSLKNSPVALTMTNRADKNITSKTISSGCFFWATLFSLK